MERMSFTTRQSRSTMPDGSITLLAWHNYSIHRGDGSHEHNHMSHIDSECGRFVTSTDHEHWYRGPRAESGEQARTFWDKRTELKVKLRG